MGAAAPKSEEFFWTDTTEPHAARRRAILAKYGDKVRALYGYDHSTAVQVMLIDISTGPCIGAGGAGQSPISGVL